MVFCSMGRCFSEMIILPYCKAVKRKSRAREQSSTKTCSSLRMFVSLIESISVWNLLLKMQEATSVSTSTSKGSNARSRDQQMNM